MIANIPGEIVKTLLPFVALFCATDAMKQNGISGMENVLLYRIFFPVFAILAICLIFFMVRGVKERVVLERSHVTKVKFKDGVKELSKNKYFWLMQIFSISIAIRGVASGNFLYWVTSFGIEGISSTAKDIIYAVAFTIIPMAFTPAMALAPFITHKIGKRNLMLYSCLCYVVVFAFQTAFASNPWIVLFCLFLQNFCAGLQLIQPVMVSDSLDYQQYKTGKRLEGFWQNYALLVTTIAGFFITLLAPLFQSFGGLKLGEVANDVLKENKEIRNGVYMYTSLLGLIGAVLTFIPIFFYDLTEKKHASIVKVLKVRAVVKNFEDKSVTDKDVVMLFDILEYAKECEDKILD
ncbi:MAG: MFS transporter, partial [Clostridia bacterium]